MNNNTKHLQHNNPIQTSIFTSPNTTSPNDSNIQPQPALTFPTHTPYKPLSTPIRSKLHHQHQPSLPKKQTQITLEDLTDQTLIYPLTKPAAQTTELNDYHHMLNQTPIQTSNSPVSAISTSRKHQHQQSPYNDMSPLSIPHNMNRHHHYNISDLSLNSNERYFQGDSFTKENSDIPRQLNLSQLRSKGPTPQSGVNDHPHKQKQNIYNINKHIYNNPTRYSDISFQLEEKNKHDKNANTTYTGIKNYQVRRFKHLRKYRFSMNPKKIDRTCKVIQKWWKYNIKVKLDYLKRVIHIQKVFRGNYTRKNFRDLIYLTALYEKFITHINTAMCRYVRRVYYPKPSLKQRNALGKVVYIKLHQYFRKWRTMNTIYNIKSNASRLMYKFRNNSRYYLYLLTPYFALWKHKVNDINNKRKRMLTISQFNVKERKNTLRKHFNMWKHSALQMKYNEDVNSLIHQRRLSIITHARRNKKNITMYTLLSRYFNKWFYKVFITSHNETHYYRLLKLFAKPIVEKYTHPLIMYFIKWKYRGINDRLLHCVNIRHCKEVKNENVIHEVLRQWMLNTKAMKLNDNAIVIQRFIKEKVKRYFNRRKNMLMLRLVNSKIDNDVEWLLMKAFGKYKTQIGKVRNKEAYDLQVQRNMKLKRSKENIATYLSKHVLTVVAVNNKQYAFNKLYNNAYMKRLNELLRNIIMRYNNTTANTLLACFNVYKRIIAKLCNKHNARIIAYFVYNKYKNKLSSLQWMNTSNKLLSRMQMNIIHLLHNIQHNKLRLQRNEIFINKIYKVFIYIKLQSLFNVLQRKLLSNSKDAFIQQLYTNYILYIRKRYNDAFRTYSTNATTTTHVPPLTQFKHSYHLTPKLSNNTNNNNNNNNNAVLNESRNKRLLPYLVEYLNKLRHSTLRYAYNKIAYNFMQKKFTLLYYAFHKKKLFPLKKELLLNMKKQEQLNKFKELIKLKIIRNVQAMGTQLWRLLKVFYLLRLTNMHKTIALDKFLKALVRKWRLSVKMAVVKRRQLMEIEKNFVETYVKIADGLFGDGNLNDPGIQMQVRDFIDKVHK